jgi:2-hydroxyacyl-CoA lyase 1
LAGARLNWILHFGLPPRFKKGVKIIQLDSDPTEAHNNIRSEVALIGDAKAILQ